MADNREGGVSIIARVDGTNAKASQNAEDALVQTYSIDKTAQTGDKKDVLCITPDKETAKKAVDNTTNQPATSAFQTTNNLETNQGAASTGVAATAGSGGNKNQNQQNVDEQNLGRPRQKKVLIYKIPPKIPRSRSLSNSLLMGNVSLGLGKLSLAPVEEESKNFMTEGPIDTKGINLKMPNTPGGPSSQAFNQPNQTPAQAAPAPAKAVPVVEQKKPQKANNQQKDSCSCTIY